MKHYEFESENNVSSSLDNSWLSLNKIFVCKFHPGKKLIPPAAMASDANILTDICVKTCTGKRCTP